MVSKLVSNIISQEFNPHLVSYISTDIKKTSRPFHSYLEICLITYVLFVAVLLKY